MSERADGPELRCPDCGRLHAPAERFCIDCAMPLAAVGSEAGSSPSGARAEARKVNPAFARGRLVRVAVGRNLSESELIAGVLLEEGIPSMLRRSGGFDVPDFLAAGPRDVLVAESGEEVARALLAEVDRRWTEAEGDGEGEEGPVSFGQGLSFKLAAGFLAGLLLFGALAGFLVLLLR